MKLCKITWRKSSKKSYIFALPDNAGAPTKWVILPTPDGGISAAYVNAVTETENLPRRDIKPIIRFCSGSEAMELRCHTNNAAMDSTD